MSGEKLDLKESLITVMRSKRASNETVILAAELIAADARSNIRFYRLKEAAAKSDDEMLQILDQAEDILMSCRASVEAFHKTGDVERLHADLLALRQEIDESAT